MNKFRDFLNHHNIQKYGAILGIVLLFSSCLKQFSHPKNQVCFQGRCVEVEIACTEAQRKRGLQLRKFLPQNFGMLFIFPHEGVHGFWMKDTLIPLDIMWLDKSKKVISIAKNVLPCHNNPCAIYTSEGNALYVLEVNAGFSEIWGIEEGVQVDFRLQEIALQ